MEAQEIESGKTSKIWVYFKKPEKEADGKVYAECKIERCGSKMLYNNSTTSLIKHVKSKHPDSYAQFEGKNSSMKQANLTSEDFKLKDLSYEKKKQITEAIARFITLNIKPIQRFLLFLMLQVI